MKRFKFLVVLLLAGLLTISCSDDDGGTAGGSGVAETNPQAVVQSAAQEAAVTEAAPQGAPAASGSGNFCLVFKQTVQPCASCGIWFDSAELVINYSDSNKPFRKAQKGNLLIKQSSGKVGRFQANLSSIPGGAIIEKATLNMNLNTHEGIAGSDNSSVITVFDCQGPEIRKITAAQDIKGKGYSKSNPRVPIDFTSYAQQVRGR